MIWYEIFISLGSESCDLHESDMFFKEWDVICHCGLIWNTSCEHVVVVYGFAVWMLSACLLHIMFVGNGIILCWNGYTCTSVSSFDSFIGMLSVSDTLHTVFLGITLRCPIAFFNVTPVRQALNHHSKDVSVDSVLPVILKRNCNALLFGM
jgi:hypothetical protein